MDDQGGSGGAITAVASLLAGLGFPGLIILLLRNFAARQDRIEILRKALDKGRVRENGFCSALDAFISAVDNLEDPPPGLIAARERALARMEEAHCQLRGVR